ncbi:hypothetical protein ACJJIX_19285 [Microbulbifer sp. VAAC004]|uniref:hypothetical protein n=1 Tax=unclassified Microbulbifer TaxID=2619833 RepID=UPI0040395489
MCYSFAVPSNGLLSELPINFQNDGLSWDQLRLDQEWEKSSSKEEIKHVLGLRGQPRASQFRLVEPGQRAYPRYFAPGIVCDESKNWLRPLRYSIRPSNSAWDLSTKYSLYNARLDRLLEQRLGDP